MIQMPAITDYFGFSSDLPKNIWDKENRFIIISLRDEKTPCLFMEID